MRAVALWPREPLPRLPPVPQVSPAAISSALSAAILFLLPGTIFLPPAPARCGFPCAKSPFLPPGAARLVFPCAKRPSLPPESASRGTENGEDCPEACRRAVAGTGNVENYPGWGWARQNVKTGGVWVEARKAGGGENKRRTCILPYFFRAIIVIFVKTDCQ